MFDKSNIRPLINIDKYAIDGACYEEKIVISCYDVPIDEEENNTDAKLTVVDVPSILSTISNIVTLISTLLIIIGVIIFVVNYKNKLKVKKIKEG